eukprot:498330_1
MSFFPPVYLFFLLACTGVLESISPEQLQSQLNAAITDRNTNSYVIPKGDYYFQNVDFNIISADNFDISASNTTTFYFNCSYGVKISNNFNVNISNIQIDYNPPCFSQGVINEPNKTEQSFIVTIDKYYPRPDKTINSIYNASVVKVIYFDPNTRQIIYNQSGNPRWNGSISLNNSPPYKYKIFMQNMGTVPKIGWLVTMGPRKGNGIWVNNCSNMLFTKFTVYGSCNMAIYEQFGHGNNIYNKYQLRRSKQNNGMNLLSSNADGFHSNCAKYAPMLNNSYLSFAGDDFVNVHNRMNIVLQRIDDFSLYVIDTWSGNTFNQVSANDSISFYKLNTLQYISVETVANIKIMRNETLQQEAKQSYYTMEQAPYNCKWATNWSNSVVVYMITFEQKLNMNVTQYMLIEYDLNQGAKITNNHFYSGLVTFIKLKSKNSIVENNIFEYAHGIHIAAEQSWLEGELGLDNIIIADNTFIGSGSQSQAIVIQNTAHNVTLYNNTFAA